MDEERKNHKRKNEEEEEEDEENEMVKLCLNSFYTSQPRSSHQESHVPQPKKLSQFSNLLQGEPFIYPFDVYRPNVNGESSVAPIPVVKNKSPPPPVPSGGPITRRARRNSTTQAPKKEGKSETVPSPFPWATTKRAIVHNLQYLMTHDITTIKGDVQCKRCERRYEIEYNLTDKFMEVGRYVVDNRNMMNDRAPDVWKDPILPTCKYCGQENSAKPVLAEKKKEINWLFLLLGQMIGCCTLEQLKYFCKHTKNHRTGAKDRVIYLTYLCLCKQLDPDGPFDV